jgi:hypothetical protein
VQLGWGVYQTDNPKDNNVSLMIQLDARNVCNARIDIEKGKIYRGRCHRLVWFSIFFFCWWGKIFSMADDHQRLHRKEERT